MTDLFKSFASLWPRKLIRSRSELLASLQNNPYNHVLAFPNVMIRPRSLKIDKGSYDFNVYADAKTETGWLMTIEGVSINATILTIRHISVHKEFRGQRLAKPCVESFISLVKKERLLTKVVFRERLGHRSHYAKFFSETLGARICDESGPVWELSV